MGMTRTVISKGDPSPEDQFPKLRTTPPMAIRETIPEKTPQKKRKVHKNQETERSNSEKTLSPTPLHDAAPKNVKEPATVTLIGLTRDATNVEKEVVNLSGNTHASTSPATIVQPSPRLELTASDAHSFHSSHHEDTEDGLVDGQFVPNCGLHDNLCICTFRACKELIYHLATLAEEEFLGKLTNVEV
ncbi:hypothetical protein Tco_1047851, partial [Tanacetum coccineum]